MENIWERDRIDLKNCAHLLKNPSYAPGNVLDQYKCKLFKIAILL